MEERLKKVVVAGGTGLVGTRLVQTLLQRGVEVVVISRHPEQVHLPTGAKGRTWEDLGGALAGADAVVNLAGEGIAKGRWSPERKRAIVESRVGSTRRIVEALAKTSHKPSVLVNASAVGIYGPRDGRPVDEGTDPGTGFLADACKAWEAAADEALGLRVVKLRLGVVLSADGGALPRIMLPIRYFQGAPLGHGQQGFSWIHIADLVALILEAAANPAYVGAINATSPMPTSNETFTRILARELHRPVLVPGWAAGLGLRLVLGEMAEEMLLKGAFVYPHKAEGLGFAFKFPRAEDALADLLGVAPVYEKEKGEKPAGRIYYGG